MRKALGIQHDVESSNLKSIGFYVHFGEESVHAVVRVVFQRGATYDYWPVTEKEFQSAFLDGVKISDWFTRFKVGKSYKEIK